MFELPLRIEPHACLNREIWGRIGAASAREMTRNDRVRLGAKSLVRTRCRAVSAGSETGDSGLIIRRSEVRVLPAPPLKALVGGPFPAVERERDQLWSLPGRCLVALRGTKRLIEPLGHRVDVGGEEVAVAVQGDRDG